MDNIIGKVQISSEGIYPYPVNYIYIRYIDGRFIYYNTNHDRYPNYPVDIKYLTASDQSEEYKEVKRIEKKFKRNLKLKRLLDGYEG